MKNRKIVMSKTLVPLLQELDEVSQLHSQMTRQLGDPTTPDCGPTGAVSIGADRELLNGRILGLAYRINRASCPEFDKECKSKGL